VRPVVRPPATSWKAAWRRLSRARGVIEGITLNDLWANVASDVVAVLEARRPAWIGIQEGKSNDYAQLLERHDLGHRYGVVQRMTSEATQGVAIVYDRTQLVPVGAVVDDRRFRGSGWEQLTPAGHGILARGVVWLDVRIAGPFGRGRVVRLADTHRLPERVPDEVRRRYDQALDEWLEASPLPVWLTIDANERRVHRLRFRGRKRIVGIDGHVITGALRYVDQRVRRLLRRTSDHAPVAALVRVPLFRRRKAAR
jgi:hypothetical protein